VNKNRYIAFIGIFLLLIYAVPIVQAVVELRKSGAVQALDILSDATITPYRRAALLHAQAATLARNSDSITKAIRALRDSTLDNSPARQLIDDAQVTCGEMKKTAVTVNRHVRLDSGNASLSMIDSFATLLAALQRSGLNRSSSVTDAVALDGVNRMASRLVKTCKHPAFFLVPIMIVDNLKYIFWNDRYLRPYEKEMENNSLFATFLRPWVQYTRYVLFGDLGEKGIPGKNGWFFFKSDVDYLVRPYINDPRSIVVDPNDKPVSDNAITAICAFKNQLQQRGIDLLVVIVPGKPNIYPDCVSSALKREDAGTFSHSLRAMDELRRQGVECIDLFVSFTAQRAIDAEAGDSIYLQKDTHWKSRGVRIAAHVVAERIKKYPWYAPGTTEYALDTCFVDRMGDVAVMTTLPAFKVRELSMSFATEKTKCYRVLQVARDSAGNETERTPYKDDYHVSQILLLGDSFSRIYQTDEPRCAGWISHIAFELSQPIASIVNDGGASTLVRQSLARRSGLLKGKKLVVWEIVERDFRFGEEGWKDVPLQASMEK